MTQFDQRGQHVSGQQYNAGRDISFGNVQTPVDLISALERLKTEISQAQQSGALSEEMTTDVQYQLTKATQEAKKPDPEKKTILDHLQTIKTAIEGVTTVANLATAVGALIKLVPLVF